ncbi:MAG: zinc-binding dehydrogenase, partial [Bacteroidota bacterium]
MGYSKIVLHEYGGPEVLQVEEEAMLPEPKSNEVRIRVQASSAAFTDCMVREGKYPGTRGVKPPMTPGYDMVGVVDKVGTAVKRLKVGQKVAELTVYGAYTEYLCLAEDRLVPVPEELDPAEAVSMILSYMTAYQMLHRFAKVKLGDKILITGAGGAVGTALLQLGQLKGLEMYGTESERKLELVSSLGGTPINYKTEQVPQRIKELCPTGVDAVFDGVGDFLSSYRMLNQRGTLVRYGVASAGTRWTLGTLLHL